MTVTTEIPKGFGLFTLQTGGVKTLRMQEEEELFRVLNPEGSNQYAPGQRRDITYISRMECMQAAIQIQLEEIKKAHPKKRVALISFNNEVNIIGDGSPTYSEIIVAGDKLSEFDNLFTIGTEFNISNLQEISESKEALTQRVFRLKETGATALGPALLIAVGIASKAERSSVILCTDGLPNIGLGTMENPAAAKNSKNF